MEKSLEQKVNEYINKMNYTWTYQKILDQWRKYNDGEYISFTAKDVVLNVIVPHYEDNSILNIKEREQF